MFSYRSPRSTTPTTSTTARRTPGLRLVAIGALTLASAGLAGCGSGGSEEGASSTDFCPAVEEFVTATKAGDRTSMADALAGAAEGLPEEAKRDVDAYVLELRASPANDAPDADGVTSDDTQEAFRS